jgi:anti-sigma B factor antagonist
MELAEVEVVLTDVAPVVYVRGEVDLSNTASIRAQIVEAVPHGAPGLVLDLTGTVYLDSSGVRLLFDLAERLQSRRQRLALVVTEAALVRRVLVLTKLDDSVPLHDTVEAALAAVAGRATP